MVLLKERLPMAVMVALLFATSCLLALLPTAASAAAGSSPDGAEEPQGTVLGASIAVMPGGTRIEVLANMVAEEIAEAEGSWRDTMPHLAVVQEEAAREEGGHGELGHRRLALGRNLLGNPNFAQELTTGWKTSVHRSMGTSLIAKRGGKARFIIRNGTPGRRSWHMQLYQFKNLTLGDKYRFTVKVKVAEGTEGRDVILSISEARGDKKSYGRYACGAQAGSWTTCWLEVTISGATRRTKIGVQGGGDKIDFFVDNTKLQKVTSPSPSPSPPSPSPPSPSPPSPIESDVHQYLLDFHNEKRALHCAPPMTWGEDIQATAQVHADYLASTGAFEHSQGTGFGENIARVTGGSDVMSVATWSANAWYDEVELCSTTPWAGCGPFSLETGHFTQVVWKGSLRLGCATKTSGTTTVVVCNYDGPGNYTGQYGQNVGQAGQCN